MAFSTTPNLRRDRHVFSCLMQGCRSAPENPSLRTPLLPLSGKLSFFRRITIISRTADRDAFLRVLKSIHDAKVLHRDLRLENLLVQDSGDVAIIDFDRAKLGSEDGLREEYEDLQRLLEDLVEDVDELVGTPIGLSGTLERGSDAEGTEEISGIQAKGKAKAVEVVDTPRFRTRRHMGVTEGKAANPVTIAPSNTKGKTRAVAVVDTGSKQTMTNAKATVVGMPLKRHTTTTAKKPTAKPITRGEKASSSGINDGNIPNKPRMANQMVLRPKPPQVRR
jgi:serine/threonine protein kinase